MTTITKISNVFFSLVIIPPVPVTAIPQPTILEEPPIPVGLRAELEPQPTPAAPAQQGYPSISLVLPKNSTSTDNQKTAPSLSTGDDASATLSQQEELSVKGKIIYMLCFFHQRKFRSRTKTFINAKIESTSS